MATTFADYTGDGNATKAFSFPSIKEADIKVDVDGVIKSSGTHYNITSYTTTGGGNVVFTSGNIPASPAAIRIFRDTDVDSAKATFTAGSSVKAGDLNNNMTQILYAAQEEQNQTILSSDIKDGAVKTVDIGADQITNALIADDQIDSEHYVDGSIDTAHLADGSVTTVKIAADAVTGAKIPDDTINSEHYAAGSIDTEHIADSQVTTAKIGNLQVTTDKLANNGVTTAKIADGAVVTSHLANDAVTTAKIADNQITTAKIANGAVDTAQLNDTAVTQAKIQDAAITTSKIASQQVSGDKISNLTVGTPQLSNYGVTTIKIAAAAVTTDKIAADNITNALIADDQIDSEHYVDGSIDTAHIGGAQVTDAKIASNSVITSKITDANVTTVKIADSNVTLAKLASDLKQTTISDSDTQLPTSGAVVDYVAAQIAPLGGLEVIATEVAFPNSQPSSGVVISISDAQGVVVNGSGTSTTGRTVGGSTVTINNFPSSLNGETLATGVGLMVSSTGSSQTYNYHKILAAETDVKQLSDDINDFNARYRVGSSNPTSALDGGDLFFNTGSGKLLVYNNTQSAWEEAQSIGQYFINTISSYSGTGGNSATFNGSAYRFVLSNPGTVAEQHIVSVNGVIQKPNSGTSQPSEGFAIDGSSIIFSSAPPSSADFFIITIGSTVNIGTPSDGTVSTSKLASGAVTTAKLADANVTTAKIADDAVTQAKIADDAVGADQLASSAVVTASIVDDAITAAKIAANAVGQGEIASGAVTGNELAAASVTASKIGANEVTTVKIADDAVTSAKIAADAIVSEHYADASIQTQYLAESAVTTSKIDNDAVTADKLANTSVTAASTAATTSDLVGDTSPQLGGTLDCNGQDVQFKSGGGNVKILFDASDDSLEFADSAQARFGAGDDLKIYHNGTDNYLVSATGHLRITNAASSKAIVFATSDANRFQISDGGHLIPSANNSYDLGDTSYRWRNVYTNDLHLSNEGHTNSVDGTWGDWTIQEGESYLFLKNNRSGKKYKFNLTEVS